ncbi:MAG: trypsin-like peptidase domain-containing protein, partial [Anaerolineales bacterium]|nr:trypsin-like peptidase domain-containing protein [Anaerolineales bacterium]
LASLLVLSACNVLGDSETAVQAPPAELENTAVTGDVQQVALNTPLNTAVSGDAIDSFETQLVSLYERVNPAVVHIFNYQGGFPQGTGTGFVYDEAGHVVTNNHVVENGERFEVVFPTGQRVEATLIGTDVDSDLAVIQLSELPAGVQPLPLGNSREVQVGQFVVAIGNPFGQESSMTLGIVSGLGRTLRSQRITDEGGQYSLPAVIQTDAPINPGNSGGPLLDLDGQVVGVNAAIRSTTGSNSGVGFSIPVNAVRRVVPSLITAGNYTYPYLGVSINDTIDLTQQEALGLSQTNGAYVTSVSPGGPADQAGLIGSGGLNQPGGDLIVAINDEPVNEFNDLISYLVFETEVGQTVQLTVIRDEQTITVPVLLGARP